ncbi:hypothetical protein [Actinoplanes sp. N902-109]|uniref:hypothetical protein n=1 Tax=Actinoplanes sp. (strain N902-109) TaxID=649831 RepID=UPI000329624E|nr:hypothetical protein [Actinoplanes sp. N902-109]AGL21683.1 hypothetical protein L083_8173 [Actinoplanes sp. N902-109]
MDDLSLDPDRTLTGGRDLAAAGESLRTLRSNAGAEVAALSGARPWGSDSFGHAFERNYRPVETQLLQAWDLLAAHVEGLGDAVVQAVHDALQTDNHASVRLQHPYGKRQ